eukprot:GEMP01045114.1.p1 GENE.GEMP01045114.1~~GEMP01045114.1.p1  ORF type:complete len:113 (-),score=1.46 GEMP01045114.1:1239-1577(-)
MFKYVYASSRFFFFGKSLKYFNIRPRQIPTTYNSYMNRGKGGVYEKRKVVFAKYLKIGNQERVHIKPYAEIPLVGTQMEICLLSLLCVPLFFREMHECCSTPPLYLCRFNNK